MQIITRCLEGGCYFILKCYKYLVDSLVQLLLETVDSRLQDKHWVSELLSKSILLPTPVLFVREKTLWGSWGTNKGQVFQHCLLTGIDSFSDWHDEPRLLPNLWPWKHYGVSEIKANKIPAQEPHIKLAFTTYHFPPQLHCTPFPSERNSLTLPRRELPHVLTRSSVLIWGTKTMGHTKHTPLPRCSNPPTPRCLNTVWRAE